MKTLEQIRERAEKFKQWDMQKDPVRYDFFDEQNQTIIPFQLILANDIERLVKAVEYLKEESTLTVQDKANKILEGIE